MSSPRKSTDLPAALTGLVLGGVSIFLVVIAVVLLTNSHFEKEKREHKAPVAVPAAAPAAVPVTGSAAGPAAH